MKKLMIGLACVAMAAYANAAQFSWKTSANAMAVTVADVLDNGHYTAGGATMKGSGNSFAVQILLYEQGTQNLVGQWDGTISGTTGYSTGGNKVNKSLAIDAIEGKSIVGGQTYDYVINLTDGVLKSLQTKSEVEKDGYIYNYSAAILAADPIKGSVEINPNGGTTLTSAAPAGWTVSGITKTEIVPEPTSAMLLLLGVAGLALKRRRA